jgi:hypothetical protein
MMRGVWGRGLVLAMLVGCSSGSQKTPIDASGAGGVAAGGHPSGGGGNTGGTNTGSGNSGVGGAPSATTDTNPANPNVTSTPPSSPNGPSVTRPPGSGGALGSGGLTGGTGGTPGTTTGGTSGSAAGGASGGGVTGSASGGASSGGVTGSGGASSGGVTGSASGGASSGGVTGSGGGPGSGIADAGVPVDASPSHDAAATSANGGIPATWPTVDCVGGPCGPPGVCVNLDFLYVACSPCGGDDQVCCPPYAAADPWLGTCRAGMVCAHNPNAHENPPLDLVQDVCQVPGSPPPSDGGLNHERLTFTQ